MTAIGSWKSRTTVPPFVTVARFLIDWNPTASTCTSTLPTPTFRMVNLPSSPATADAFAPTTSTRAPLSGAALLAEVTRPVIVPWAVAERVVAAIDKSAAPIDATSLHRTNLMMLILRGDGEWGHSDVSEAGDPTEALHSMTRVLSRQAVSRRWTSATVTV